MKTYVSFQFSKQEKLIVTLSSSHRRCRLSFAPNITVSCPLAKIIFEGSLFTLSFVINLRTNFKSGNPAKSFEVFKRLLLDYLT